MNEWILYTMQSLPVCTVPIMEYIVLYRKAWVTELLTRLRLGKNGKMYRYVEHMKDMKLWLFYLNFCSILSFNLVWSSLIYCKKCCLCTNYLKGGGVPANVCRDIQNLCKGSVYIQYHSGPAVCRQRQMCVKNYPEIMAKVRKRDQGGNSCETIPVNW